MSYKVVPFHAHIQVGQGPAAAADQFAAIVNGELTLGWRYLRMETVVINVHDPGSAGCMGLGCFGVRPPSMVQTRFDMIVFERSSP